MYDQINPTQMFRERQLALLEEADNGRIARRLRAGGSSHRARSGMAALLAPLVLGGLMLVALSSPAHASTTLTVNSAADLADVNVGDGICDADAAVGNLPRSDAGANLISGNDGAGIAIRDLASQTEVVHNLIGTDKSGTKKLGNSKEGVEITNSSNNSLDSNTIAFNGGNGVKI